MKICTFFTGFTNKNPKFVIWSCFLFESVICLSPFHSSYICSSFGDLSLPALHTKRLRFHLFFVAMQLSLRGTEWKKIEVKACQICSSFNHLVFSSVLQLAPACFHVPVEETILHTPMLPLLRYGFAYRPKKLKNLGLPFYSVCSVCDGDLVETLYKQLYT